jgi:hypothetical protein
LKWHWTREQKNIAKTHDEKKGQKKKHITKKEQNITNRRKKTDQNIQMDFSETSFFPLTGLYFKCFVEQSSSPVQENL